MRFVRSLILTLLVAISLAVTTCAAGTPAPIDEEAETAQVLPEAVVKMFGDDENKPFETVHIYSPELNRMAANLAVFGVVCLVTAILGFIALKYYERRYLADDIPDDQNIPRIHTHRR